MPVTDLNCEPYILHAFPSNLDLEKHSHVHRQIGLCANHRSPSASHLTPLHSTIRRKPSHQKFQLPGPVSLHGFRPVNLPGKPARHRSLPTRTEQQTLSHGHTSQSFSQYFGRSQRKTRLAHLRRLCSVLDSNRTSSIHQRQFWYRSQQYRLCTRFNHHRSLSFGFPLGAFSSHQGRRQTTYSIRPARQYTHVYSCFNRQVTRRQFARYFATRGWCFLHHRSRLPRLRTITSIHTGLSVLCHSGQIESKISAPLLSANRQIDWASLRPNRCINRLLFFSALPRKTSPNQIPRSRNWQDADLSNQQFLTAGNHNCRAIQVPLASRTVFQMDQAAPPNQIIFRNIRECREDTNLDRSIRLCAGRHHQKAEQLRSQFIYNSTDFKFNPVRKNSPNSTTYQL
jgi:hypothetical protein